MASHSPERQQADLPDKDEALLFSNPFDDLQTPQRVTTFEWALGRSAELACFAGDAFAAGCRQIAGGVGKLIK